MHDRIPVTVPVAVAIERWRGRTDDHERILGGVRVEPLHLALARAAGEALASVKSASAVDAVVMASAALRGDIVYTSDVGDLETLRRYFPTVRVLAVYDPYAPRPAGNPGLRRGGLRPCWRYVTPQSASRTPTISRYSARVAPPRNPI
jgi:hypothetical protein